MSQDTDRPKIVIEKKPLESEVSDVMGGSARWEVKIHDHGLVALLDVMPRFAPVGKTADFAIVQAARVSYGHGTKQVNEDRGLIRYLARHRHTTPFEMVEFKFHHVMPIFVARQWIRHRTANVNEYSARYSVVRDRFYRPSLESLRQQSTTNRQGGTEQLDPMTAEEFNRYLDAVEGHYADYQRMLDIGVARELARIGLPLNVYTEWYWKIDLHNLLHFLSLRMDPHAQQEIRDYANATFTCLLQVTLGPRHRLLDVRRLDDRHGVYFGLTRHRDHVFAVARNLDVNERVPDPARPSNNVIRFAWPWRGDDLAFWSVPETRGVHQIRFHDGLLWLVNCRHPELVAFDPARGTVAGSLSLAGLVPDALRHEPPPEVPVDRYHFNSLVFSGDRLLVLAHNWGYGSFALELEYPGAAALFRAPRLVRAHTGLGLQSHDIYLEGGRLYVLDSGNGRLLSPGAVAHAIGPAYGERHCFARGLAVGRDCFYAGHGTFGTRAQRVTGPTQITVLDRRSLETVAVVDVGAYGNPCDLLLVSEPDWSDVAAPA